MDGSISSHHNPSVSTIGTSPPQPSSPQLPTVQFSPAAIVRHRTAHWRGVQAKTVQIISHEHFEYSFKEQCHLLVAVEQGVRYDGETFVEGLPTSTIRHYSHKLIFVPAGRRFFGAQNPRLLTRSICLYIDPQSVLVDPDLRFAEAELQPRLLFEDRDIWETVRKLKAQIGSIDPGDRMYADALAGLLAHELLRLDGATAAPRRVHRPGGLVGWQHAHHGFHGRAPCGGHFAQHAGRSRAAEPVSFPAIFQAVLRRAATSILDCAADRARKDLTGTSARIHY